MVEGVTELPDGFFPNSPADMASFYEQLRGVVLRRGVTQQSIAKKMNVHPTVVSKLLNGYLEPKPGNKMSQQQQRLRQYFDGLLDALELPGKAGPAWVAVFVQLQADAPQPPPPGGAVPDDPPPTPRRWTAWRPRRAALAAAAAAVVAAAVVVAYLAWPDGTVSPGPRPSALAATSHAPAASATVARSTAGPASPATPQPGASGDYRTTFGAQTLTLPAAPQPDVPGLVTITVPVAEATVGSPDPGNPDHASELVQGSATLGPDQHLWIFLYGTGSHVYYFEPREAVAVTAGRWQAQIWLVPKEPGRYWVYAVVVDDHQQQQLTQILAEHPDIGSPALYQLPPGIQAAYVPVQCCRK